MPYKPKSPCSFPGCPSLSYDRYCDKHRKAMNNHYNKYQRDPKINKRYDNRWRKIRKEYVKSYPLCEMCKQEGRLTPAQEVHHILSIDKGGTHDPTNLMSLCKSCHSFESAKSGERWGRNSL